MRVLATEVGVTHALLYHYFPTKQALIERVYYALCEGRWNVEWEVLLDDPTRDVEDKFNAFYRAYSATVLTRDFVRVFMFSGLSDRYITDRFFTLLRTRLFPRLIRETRRHCGIVSRRKPSSQEFELLMGLHGGIFYTGVRRYIYEQAAPMLPQPKQDEDLVLVRDRVHAYLLAARAILRAPAGKNSIDVPVAKGTRAPSIAVMHGASTVGPASGAVSKPAAKRVLKGR